MCACACVCVSEHFPQAENITTSKMCNAIDQGRKQNITPSKERLYY